MSHSFSIDGDRNLVVLVFRGEISYQEEVEALLAVLGDPRLRPDARILVDKTNAAMMAMPKDAQQHVELVRSHGERLGRPRVAHAVSRDSDFGMLRMLELVSEHELDHEFHVFRKLEEACEWLGVDPADLPTPDR